MGTELFNAAASGSIEAQSALADRMLLGADQGALRPIEALSVAEVLARMAARNGDDPTTLRRLAGVLILRGQFERLHGDEAAAAALDAEGLLALDVAADLGDEHAVGLLVELRQHMPDAGFDLLRQKARGGGA